MALLAKLQQITLRRDSPALRRARCDLETKLAASIIYRLCGLRGNQKFCVCRHSVHQKLVLRPEKLFPMEFAIVAGDFDNR
jgi:hypothetical protein